MKAIIIEDESLIARELQYKLKDVAPDVTVVAVLHSLKTAKKWFMENTEPDIIFADIQLSDGISFELFEQYKISCPVIFTTAYDEYAIRAFKVNGIDYLLKPVDSDELQEAVEKFRQYKNPGESNIQVESLLQLIRNNGVSANTYKEKILVKFRQSLIPVATKDIACFVRDNLNYCYTFSGEKYILDYVTLDEIMNLLDPHMFYRANRQCIVHIDAIERVQLHENLKLTLFLKAPQKMQQDISREKQAAFKKWFDR
ncbi:MAG: response regulator transcription factor [Chitinophagaceae bacterium]|nr:response regulator transcription factor [Chitinophagaceae bacterium]